MHVYHPIKKIERACYYCKGNNVYTRFWTDYYPEGSRLYDDTICADCGRYINTVQYLCLNKEDLRNFRITVGLETEALDQQNIRELQEFLGYRNKNAISRK
jgi:hypothetical protein